MLFRQWPRRLTLCAVIALGLTQAHATDTPLSTLSPAVFALEPGVDATPVRTTVKLSTGESHPALLVKYESRVTYDVPNGASCFSGVLLRADSAQSANGAAGDINRIRVRFLLDGKPAYDTVLDVTMPPEQFAVPVGSAKELTIAVDQMLEGGAVYLAEAVFSSRSIPHASSSHVLPPGTGYLNLGSGVRQVAFRVYHPGESVPLQLEFAGAAKAGSVSITITPLRQAAPISLTVPVTLRPERQGSGANTSWQVPSLLGPARLQVSATVNGKQIYRQDVLIAIARRVDIAKDRPASTFGVHLSSAGIPYLTDAAADLWGANWGRVFLRWEIVEFTRGQYDWRRIDELVDMYLAQNMQILGVLGETAPKWAAPAGAETTAAFQRFVKAAVEHLQSKIRYWDVYNEIDVKHQSGMVVDHADPAADVRLLRKEMSTIRAVQPAAKLVCCSTGASYWLTYDKRLFDSGLLNSIDIVALHPYQSGPPEQRESVLSYLEMINRLRGLERTYGADKPVWSTEANWIIGAEGQKGVTAPYVNEHAQSQYLVRVNLLSMALAVPYFVHSPFFTPFHRELFQDSLAAYANMTYNLGASTGARLLDLPDGIYGISASSGARTICVLWTTRTSARVKIAGVTGSNFQDLYGNRVTYDPASVPLSGDPVYVTATGSPSITVEQIDPAAAAKQLPNPWTWEKSFFQKYTQTQNGVRVTSHRTNYGTLLKSPKIDVSPNSCYVLSSRIHTVSGGVAMVALDFASGKRLGATVNIFNVTGHDDYVPELRLRTGSTSQLQIELIADNPEERGITDFEISRPQISRCGGE